MVEPGICGDIEYLRLPRGFSARAASSFEHLVAVQSAVCNTARLAGLETLLLPSVAFSSTFQRVPGVMGDKAFEFADRKGRRLTLAPDSSPALLRWYVETNTKSAPKRIGWFAPVFRYRKQNNRAFHQFGISFINGYHQTGCIPDYELAEATNILLTILARDFGVVPTVRLTNVGSVRRILTTATGCAQTAEAILSELHFCKSDEDSISVLQSRCESSPYRDALIEIFRGNVGTNGDDSYSLTTRHLVDSAIEEMKSFANLLRHEGVVEFSISDLHSSQLVSEIGLQLLGQDGQRLGDGGRYDIFGRAFHPSIQSFVSVCSGGEALERCIKKKHRPKTVLTVLTFPNCLGDALKLVEMLRLRGIPTHLEVVAEKLKAVTTRVASSSWLIAVLGRHELSAGEVNVRWGQTGETEIVKLGELVGFAADTMRIHYEQE